MDYIIYILIFIIGTVFGSFFTLAVYRIPLNQDITHTRSYCPNCNHKLSFFDMIPIFSYLFLGGKCRYCKQKIRIRYFILEILTGFIFVIFAVSIKFSIYNIIDNMDQLIYIIVGILYIVTLIIIAGIDKENIKVEKSVLLFGFICIYSYIIYLYIVKTNINIYRYVIYLILMIFVNSVDIYYLRKKSKQNYLLDIVELLLLMNSYTYEAISIYTITTTLLAVIIQLIINKLIILNKKCVKNKKIEKSRIPIAFYMCAANIFSLITINFYMYYR